MRRRLRGPSCDLEVFPFSPSRFHLHVCNLVCIFANAVSFENAGVEGVMIDTAKNEVTIKGIVEPQAVCNKIMKKTKRKAKVLSPLPAAEGEPMPEVVASQVHAQNLN